MHPTLRLTSLAHGGGCGCKIAPAVLREILAGMPAAGHFANLMVGTETSDDAAVWRLNDTQALVATTDFFMPVVEDPYEFGRIAATNALSDVYAMGATPILALAIVGMPIDKLAPEVIGAIERTCSAAHARGKVVLANTGYAFPSIEGQVAHARALQKAGVDLIMLQTVEFHVFVMTRSIAEGVRSQG